MIAPEFGKRTRGPSPAATQYRRVLNAGSGPRTIRKLRHLFEPARWEELRLDLDAKVRPDFVGSMTDMRDHFSAASFDAIWSSHSLEHLHDHEIPLALGEFRRVLRDDGFALISCPDLETVMSLFLRHGPDYVAYQSPAGPITPVDMLFGHTRSIASGNHHMAHRSGLTAERLGGLLLRAGFAEAITKRAQFDLWALALMRDSDRDAILDRLRASGLDMTSN